MGRAQGGHGPTKFRPRPSIIQNLTLMRRIKEIRDIAPPITTPMCLRDYQEDILRSCHHALANGLTRIGISSPTGSGKTVVFVRLIKELEDKKLEDGQLADQVLMLAPSGDIARQMARTAQAILGPRVSIGHEYNSYRSSGKEQM